MVCLILLTFCFVPAFKQQRTNLRDCSPCINTRLPFSPTERASFARRLAQLEDGRDAAEALLRDDLEVLGRVERGLKENVATTLANVAVLDKQFEVIAQVMEAGGE